MSTDAERPFTFWQMLGLAAINKAVPKTAAKKAITFLGWDTPSGAPQSWGNTTADRAKFAMDVGDPLNTSLVMAAVKWMSRHVYEAPLDLVTRDRNRRVVARDSRHPAIDLLNHPNEYTTGKELHIALHVSFMLSGNAYVIKKRSMGRLGGVVESLWFEPHFSCRPRWPGDRLYSSGAAEAPPMPAKTGPGSEFISWYEVWRQNRWVRIDKEDVIHFKDGQAPSNPRLGINGLAALLAELFTDMQRAHFAATVLANIGMIPFVVSPRDANSSISELQAEKLKEALVLQARQDRGKPIVAGRAIRIDELGFSPQDMDLTALASIPQTRVASVLGPNARVLGFDDHSTFSTYVEARESAIEDYLMPLEKYFAEKWTDGLFRELDYVEQGDNRRALEPDYSEVAALQDQVDKKYARVGRAYRDGVLDRFEARLELNQKADEERDRGMFVDLNKGHVPGAANDPESPTNDLAPPGKPRGPIVGYKGTGSSSHR